MPVTIHTLREWKRAGERFAMLTCYDYTTARILAAAEIPVILVGDSMGNVMLGYGSTLPVDVEDIAHHARAVARGAPDQLLVGDMPFGSYQCGTDLALRNAALLLKTGMHTVKLEGAGFAADITAALVERGIPVMGHVGLTPQTATALGGYKAQGRSAKSAIKLLEDALALQSVGCFAIVIEAVPSAIADEIAKRLEVPTIGIGAGRGTSGQVLVFHDLLGITTGHMAKFVKRYASVHETMVEAVKQYGQEVRTRHFPEPEHVYSVEPAELDEFRRYLSEESLASAKGWEWEPLP